MSPGYGQKIYVQKQKSRRPVWLVFGLLLVVGLFALWLKRERVPILNTPPQESIRPALVSAPEDPKASPDNLTADNGTTANEYQDEEKATAPSAPSPTPSQPSINNPNDTVRQLIAESKLHINQREFREALEKLSPLTDTTTEAQLLAAQCHFALQHYQESQQLLEKYHAYDPNNLEVIKHLANVCFAQNLLKETLSWCEKGLTIQENDIELKTMQERINRELATAESFTSRQSEHFVVSFDRGSHDDVRQDVLSILEEAYRSVGQELEVYPERTIPVILYSQQAFFDVTRAPGWAGGLYDGKIRLPIAQMEGNEKELTRILTHEYTHALVHQLCEFCPRWLNEGLAEYTSQDTIPKIGQIIPLNELEQQFPSAPTRAVAIAYAQSHAAVAYLIDRYSLSDVLNLLKRLGKGEGLNDAFKGTFYIEYARFLSDWGK